MTAKMEDFVTRMQALRIGSKYQLVRKLGAGTFGIIYLGMKSPKG